MKRKGNIFAQIISFENLCAAAYRAFRGKKLNSSVSPFVFNLEKEVIALHEELTRKTYRPLPYGIFEIREPKVRQICSSHFRDRVVHHAICNALEPLIEKKLIFDTYACRIGKGNHAAVIRAKGFARKNLFFLKCDISKYFPSIDHAILKEHLARLLKDRELLDLLYLIIDHQVPNNEGGKGLPIGNLTSQYFANLYLSPLDHHLKDYLRTKYYIRYMDDFLIFEKDKEPLWQILEEIRVYLQLKLRLNLKEKVTKIAPVSEGVPFLGFRIFDNLVRLQRPNLIRFRKKMRARERAYLSGDIDESELVQSTSSMLAFIKHANTTVLRRKDLERSMKLA